MKRKAPSGPEGVEVLGESLRMNLGLSKLSLTFCGLDGEAARDRNAPRSIAYAWDAYTTRAPGKARCVDFQKMVGRP